MGHTFSRQKLPRLGNEPTICRAGNKSSGGEMLVCFDHCHCSSLNIPFNPMLGVSPTRGLEYQQRSSEAILGNDLLSGHDGLLSARGCALARRLDRLKPPGITPGR
jgi:hypothetical protein